MCSFVCLIVLGSPTYSTTLYATITVVAVLLVVFGIITCIVMYVYRQSNYVVVLRVR